MRFQHDNVEVDAMATTAKHPRAGRKTAQDSASEINKAFLQLLKAIPVDHLDRRLAKLEKWVGSLERDMVRLGGDVRRVPLPAARRRAAAAKVTAPRRPRRAAHQG